MTSGQDVSSHYQHYFQMLKATTEELKSHAFQIRHDVYYVEEQMITEQQVFNQRESDSWDECADHCLLLHKPSQTFIGTVRMIPKSTSPYNSLPVEKHYPMPFDFIGTSIKGLDDCKTGEISRMAILSSFRRRSCDTDFSEMNEQPSDQQNRRFAINYMPMCLTFAAIHLLLASEKEYGIALMEPRLAKLLKRFGVVLMQIGGTVEFYGQRAPFLINPVSTANNLVPEYQGLFDLVGSDLGC
ncbi:MAG: PEP-CTERM/exosortase system-associated acyltransferase [Methylicorpusculum sp.]|uniref:PEP-CTERM/exosortase system-associated acyltransferase n=2 Tax=Methylicorpusculum sp. TaxID=2713644 RepID=UPI00271CE095|nr:PEP-CTERM/exosortase system-associated acyltransferase [Methylicorpusculum sp.]MDO8843356.1 PEP-CTERM/exosortase system-associated acyltransferase [Methylicorpusculum sp.]MDO8939498.1 PEP-CTERM/exosortase system-associated acyltransferase [Methylicorpusculum sp.]MDO9241119.1 PEP-CTERM/exosortase system-associated acyltransferase [Methylicorpusculum sp.]MDP2177687.1 PEP-CTERM/exosortase system-associated acyltransferase [Methylicorpusculum sp.]MDP2203578.1 PEP-CTERM/exosortase system-associa